MASSSRDTNSSASSATLSHDPVPPVKSTDFAKPPIAAIDNPREMDEVDEKSRPSADAVVDDNDAAWELAHGRKKDIYDRFGRWQKMRVTCVVAFCAVMAPFTASIFLPSIPQMSSDLNTTPAIINYTVAVFIVMIGFAPVVWSPLSGFYGRRPIYLASMPIMVVSSVGVALSNNVASLVATRILQAIGCSCVLAVGAGSIGDIYRPTERADAMGWYLSGVLMGPAIAPLVGGIFTEYTALTWRSSQYFLAGVGCLALALTFFFLPETSHPPLPHTLLKEEQGKKFVVYYFNPLTSLGLFRWPNICMVTLVSSVTLMETYAYLIPLSIIFQQQYGITNNLILGVLFLANGGGNIIGTRIGGRLADMTVRRYLKKRGYRRPEDRLRTSLIPAGIILPATCIAYGWLINSGAGGIAPPLVMMVLNATAVIVTLMPVNTYLIDSMQQRSAEVMAVNNFIRYLFSAASSAFVLPMADAVGWGWTMTLCALVAWLSVGILWLVIHKGEGWREAANKRYGYVLKGGDMADGARPTDVEAPANATTDVQPIEAEIRDEKQLQQQERQFSTISAQKGAHSEHEEAHGEPGLLVSPPAPKSKAQRAGPGPGPGPSLDGGADLTRQGSRMSGVMPPVGEVLARTVSLSGVSVHGGG